MRPIVPAVVLAVAAQLACGGGAGKVQEPPAATQAETPTPAAAGSAQGEVETITGQVAESMNSGGYTYVRLQSAGKSDTWIAAPEIAVKVGDRLTAPIEMPMENFHSKTLNRDFPVIYFVSQVAREGETLSPAPAQSGAPAPMGSHQASSSAPVPVEPVAPAPGGLSIADVWAKRTSLAGKPVVVRGKVVKANNGIMDRNWLHLQDGSGSAADRTNDLTVTTAATAAEVKVGDIVTVSGVLAAGKDFGAGYAYDAILETAKVTGK